MQNSISSVIVNLLFETTISQENYHSAELDEKRIDVIPIRPHQYINK